MVSATYTEDALIEQPAIAVFRELGWQYANCFGEFEGGPRLGRETSTQVVLTERLRAALVRLNPGVESEAIQKAIEELTRDRSVMSMVAANREVYKLLKDGVKVTQQALTPGPLPPGEGVRDTAETITVRVIDWDAAANNDFFLASQFWVSGDMYKRRADLVGFVNGLPLLFVELKAAHRRVQDAYDKNLRDYKDTIPHLFWYNAFILLSNGSESRLGSLTAHWEHFAEWKRINSEGERGVISLDTMIRAACTPARLLDIVENFTLFDEGKGGLTKLIARNHQYLGVNNAIAAVQSVGEKRGRLGVFWHTQGSGKSYSMVFFGQKVLRKLPGNWTFVVVTDRDDLDGQIYKYFAGVGAVTEPEQAVRAGSGEHLQQLLREDHRYIFTLVQKFHTAKGATYPMLSERADVIVMTDEAHRSQYDTFALNMRNALPNAAFIGFTGTPLMAGEEKTRAVFGDYVSIYNFKQSIDDGATVPLYYENRIPELQLTNKSLNADMADLLDAAALDDEQQQRVEREFAQEYQLITRDDRLEKIAADIVAHFIGRGHKGKAMVVSIDKATAVRMYDKVQKHWKMRLAELLAEDDEVRNTPPVQAMIRYLQETDMAVVVSQAQNEVDDFRKLGLDIATHRKRLVKEDLETKFKDAADPLRIVFVCAMWMTGFDVPSCSTIYLDKPMRNHTLMQTIARANRVYGDKVNGLIVDYVGVFRNLQQALAIYGSTAGGDVGSDDMPVKDKSALVALLRQAIAEATAFCTERGVRLEPIMNSPGFERVVLLDNAVTRIVDKQVAEAVEDSVERIVLNDALKLRFLALAGNCSKLYKAILPDVSANRFSAVVTLLGVIAEKIRTLIGPVDVTAIMDEVARLLDKSVAAEAYVIRNPLGSTSHLVDLGQIDFEALKVHFEQGRKHIDAEKLRGVIASVLGRMVEVNKSRMDFVEEFQRLIDDYNAGSHNVEKFFADLLAFAQKLNGEEKRHMTENLSEEELAVFDLLTRPDMQLSKDETAKVKKVASELLETLKREKISLDWRKRQQSRAAVQLAIADILDHLPERYTTLVYRSKCDVVYQHVFDSYFGPGQGAYAFNPKKGQSPF